MSSAPESLTLTFVFTDIVGSTELIQQLGEDRARTVFARHHRSLARDVAAHGGEELEWLGDGMLAAFASSSQAIRCALVMQRRTHRRVGNLELHVRIGVHTGEAMRRQGGYFGNTVVLARRLCDAASAGQVLTSGFVASMLSGRQFGFGLVGELELKGIPQPVAVYEVAAGRSTASGEVAETRAAAGMPPSSDRIDLPDGREPGAVTASTPTVGRRTGLLAAVVGVASLVGVAGLLLAAGLLAPSASPNASPSGSSAPPSSAEARQAVVQLLPVRLWRDPDTSELIWEPIATASGVIIDSRGLLLTSRAAVDGATYQQRLDAVAVAMVDASGRSQRPAYLAQTVATSDEFAMLAVVSDIDGVPLDEAATEFASVAVGTAGDVSVGDRLELIGFTSAADSDTRLLQTSRETDATGFVRVGDSLGSIQTGASMTSGDRGGAAVADGRLVGILVEDPAADLTAAIMPIDRATSILAGASAMLDARRSVDEPRVTLTATWPDAPIFEFDVDTEFEGMANGMLWSWSCIGPDGEEHAATWPSVGQWTAGAAPSSLRLRCATASGFALAGGTYRVAVNRVDADGTLTALAEGSFNIPESGPGAWRAEAPPPAYALTIPQLAECITCDEPYPLTGMAVFNYVDPRAVIPEGLPEEIEAGQLGLVSYADTEHAATPLAELADHVADEASEVVEQPSPTTVGGMPAVRVGVRYANRITGSGPSEGATFLPDTRRVAIFVAVDGVNLGISMEVVEADGFEERLAELESAVESMVFQR